MNTFPQSSISVEACMSMFAAAQNKAREIGFKVAFTVVDAGGNTKFFARMDGAPLMASDISRKKAVTAVGLVCPQVMPGMIL